MKKSIIYILFTVILFSVCSNDPAYNTITEPITTEYIIRELSHPHYRGRLTGMPGNYGAGEFLQNVFGSIGLAPFLKSNYRWEFRQRVYDPDLSDPRMTLHFVDGTERSLVFGRNFTMDVAAVASVEGKEINVRFNITFDEDDSNIDSLFYIFPSGNFFSGTTAPYYIYPEKDRLIIWAPMDALPDIFDYPEFSQPVAIGILDNVFNSISWNEVAHIALQVNNSAVTRTVYNVVGFIPGNDRNKAVVIGAHFDGVGYAGGIFSPAAYDNASGVAALVHMAQTIMAWNDAPATDIVFAAFNGEESGLWGSDAFAAELIRLQRYDSIFYINFDCVGSTTAHLIPAKLPFELTLPLTPFLDEWDIAYDENELNGGSSDDEMFYWRGIPYLSFTPLFDDDSIYSLMHIADDLKERLRYEDIDNTAKMTAAYVNVMGARLPALELNLNTSRAVYREANYLRERMWRRGR